MRCNLKNGRQAVTLLELLVVLALLAAIAGMVVPTFESMVSSRRLLQSIEKLRNELAEARVTAMRTGQAQVLRATLQSQDYSITPWLGGTDDENASAGAVVSSGGQVVQTQTTAGAGVTTSAIDTSDDVKQLSEGVLFSAIETLMDDRNAFELEQSGEATGGATPGVSPPVLFYPDGSSTTAQVILVDPRGRRMAIQIRGVTGQLTAMRLTGVDPSTVTPIK
jgi:prepilin-type N-terminal cleavage/methylation domain-containing protein